MRSPLTDAGNHLPIQSNLTHKEVTAETGIVFGEPIDELMESVTLPDGWTIRTTEHPMHNELVDGAGNVRAEIFYNKAELYDRRADIFWKMPPKENDHG